MNRFEFRSLGETWIQLVRETLQNGDPLGGEAVELLAVEATFPAENGADLLLERFADKGMISEMRKVFFGDGPNSLGHNYARKMKGPAGRADLSDIISLLRDEPLSKRAVVTLCGFGDGRVPCINVIQFLIRGGKLETFYFARGQDAFRKFYADGYCIAEMARRVAAELNLPAGSVTGFIGSSHIYEKDLPAIRQVLAEVNGGDK